MRHHVYFLCALVPFLGSAAGVPSEGQDGEPQQATEKLTEGVRTGVSTEAASDQVRSLQRISALKMRFGGVSFSSSELTTQSFAELVNPFKVRKRGRFYGSLYEFHRNDNFDARNFFDPVGQPLPEFKRNQFGASFGAFLSDKLNVFGTYDGLRINRGSTRVSHIPTEEMKRGDFRSLATLLTNPFTGELFENNQIPESMIHPVSRRMLGIIPAPNRLDAERNFVNNLPEIRNEDSFSGRIDYEFSDETKLFGQYELTKGDRVEVQELPAFGTNQESRRHRLSLDLARNFGNAVVGSFRTEFRRSVMMQLSKNVDQGGLLDSLGIEGVSKLDELDEGYPEFRMDGYATLGLGGHDESPRTFFNNGLEFDSGITYALKNHRLSFGAEIEFRQINNNRTGSHRRGSFEFSGNYSGDAFADFLLGIPGSALRGVGSDRQDVRASRWGLSFRDEWKINPKFNLSFLLAYNYYDPYRSVHDNVSVFWPLLFEPPMDGQLVTTGSIEAENLGLGGLGPGEAVYPDRNDWAPGIGVAYSPLGNNRLVLRGSYQISYSPMESRDIEDYLGRNYPFFYIEEADASIDSPDLDLSHPFDSVTPSEKTIRQIDPHIRTPYIQQWQLVLQNEFLRNWTLELAYEGRKSTRLRVRLPANVPLPGSGVIQQRRPNPEYGVFRTLSGSGSSIGHILKARVEKRLSRGFSVRSSFTWDRTLSDVFFRDPSNPRDLRAERSLYWYSPKGFELHYIYDLPVGPEKAFSSEWAGPLGWLFQGWRLSGIANILGGRPFHPELKGDPNNDGLSGDRPDRLASGRLGSAEQSIDRWFATEAFAEPGQFLFGNSGRSILFAPSEQVWDISLIKRTRLSREGSILEFRVQFFNAFNHVNFREPEEILGTTGFGQIFGAEEAREIEFAIKYSF